MESLGLSLYASTIALSCVLETVLDSFCQMVRPISSFPWGMEREIHPQAVGELVFMDKVGRNSKRLPRGLVVGITIGNLHLYHVLTGFGFEVLADKTFSEFDGYFFTLGGLRICVFQ